MSEAIQAAIEDSRAREKHRHVPYGDLHREYAFREALAVAGEALGRIREDALDVGLELYVHSTARKCIADIEAILSGKEAT
jgi:hypothetical protein